jgi:excisionase family DNA binding protein
MEFPMPEPYVDADVASRHLSVARKTLSEMARTGKIPAYPWGVGTQRRSWRFKISELDSWMRSRVVSECHPLPNRRRT